MAHVRARLYQRHIRSVVVSGQSKSVKALWVRAVPEIILGGGGVGHRPPFCPVGGGCFVDNVSKGWGVTCPGGQSIFDP